MAQQQPGNFAEDFVSVLSSPPALVALLVLMVLSGGQAVLVNAQLAEWASSMGMAAVGLVLNLLLIFQGIAAFTIQFVLSRMLGSADGKAGQANFGAWLGFALLYFLVAWIANAMVTFVAGIATGSSYWLIPLASGVIGMLVRVALFPLLVRLVSLAHDREGPSFSMIWACLTGERPGIYGGYAGLCLLVALLPAVSMIVRMGSDGGPLGTGVYLVLGLVSAFTQLLLFCYAITAYRAVAAGRGSGDVFS